MSNRQCPCCGNKIESNTTTFTVVKKAAVYVVEDTPCLLYPVCEYTAFTKHTTKKLETLTSGRVLPLVGFKTAWVFKWDQPIMRVDEASRSSTENRIYSTAGTISA